VDDVYLLIHPMMRHKLFWEATENPT